MKPQQFAGMLRGLMGAVENDPFDEELDKVSEEFRTIQVENFVSESDAGGVPWAPRKAAYKHPPLRKSLKMFEAATAKGKPGSLESRAKGRVTFKIDNGEVPYASRQQKGSRDGKTPARQYYYVKQVHHKRLKKPFQFGLIRILYTEAKRAATS